MDTDVMSYNDADVEEGELSDTSEEVYIPLQRPVTLSHSNTSSVAPTTSLTNNAKCAEMDADTTVEKGSKSLNNLDDEEQSDDFFSSSGDSSDTCLDKTKIEKKSKRRKSHIKRTVMVRVQQTSDSVEQKKARFKKYDIWTAALQEDALTENMRGCDVTQNGLNDRNVENYDFSLKYRLNGENSLKRRLSNSTDDHSDSEQSQPHNKRKKSCAVGDPKRISQKRSIHERLGKRKDFQGRRRASQNSVEDCYSNSYAPKHIEDLEDVDGRDALDVAKEIAMKLHEEKDELLVRIVEVLGTELPLKVYKETQRIEAEGGMTIKNGQRRRTPGGVFLFLLKNHDSLSAEDQKAIFSEDRNIANKKQKEIKASIRDQKVKELKKRLCEKGTELPYLNSRKELLLLVNENSQKQNDGNLSNPPPSPEAYEQNEFDLISIPINHVANDAVDDLSDQPSTSRANENITLQTYEDDFLDVNCGDMDLF